MSSPEVGRYRLEASTVMDSERSDYSLIFLIREIRTRGFRVVSGLNRLLKLSARMTACKTSSSSSISLSGLFAMEWCGLIGLAFLLFMTHITHSGDPHIFRKTNVLQARK